MEGTHVQMPKGRRLRNCDAVAVPLYSVEDRLLTALFKPRAVRSVSPGTEAPPLSAAAIGTLDATCGPPSRHESAPSEGTFLTKEEEELIRKASEEESDSETDTGDDLDVDGEIGDPRAGLIQANGSAYHALVLTDMPGGVGLGVSRAFSHARECKARHAVLLLGAGHFAACIFGPDGRVEQHRTCRRYVVRGKQGGAQGSHDKKSGKAASIGAQMRREGEKKLAEDVSRVMREWTDHLQSCKVIFVSCPPARRSTLFGTSLQFSDPRVRRVPFAGLGKANMTACITAHSLLCSVLFFRSWPARVCPDELPSFPERHKDVCQAAEEKQTFQTKECSLRTGEESIVEEASLTDEQDSDVSCGGDAAAYQEEMPRMRERRPRPPKKPAPRSDKRPLPKSSASLKGEAAILDAALLAVQSEQRRERAKLLTSQAKVAMAVASCISLAFATLQVFRG